MATATRATVRHRWHAELAHIVAHATFLTERRAGLPRPNANEAIDDKAARDRLARLSQAVAAGDREAFERWLQWNESDVAQLTVALQDAFGDDDDDLPPWADTVGALFDAASRPRSAWPEAQPAADNEIPFQYILAPALHVARHALLEKLNAASRHAAEDGSLLDAISTHAYASLERSLTKRLAFVASPTLVAEFTRHRPAGLTLLAALDTVPDSDRRAFHYSRFVDRMLEDGLRSVLTRYPVLARFIAVAVDQWVDATAEFLQRLRRDRLAIETMFRSAGTLGLVAAIEPDLSDAHNGGRSTLALTFDCGLRLMYKPKSLGLEAAYVDLLRWCSSRGLSTPLMTQSIIDRGAYGWAECVVFRPCDDEAAVSRLFRRAGMQLCLLYVLGATDCHAENLIACGEDLILIDMETLLGAEPSPILPDDDPDSFDSVLRSGLLPQWECRYDTRFTVDVSGLGFVEAQPMPHQQWVHTNTDAMHLVFGLGERERLQNVPLLGTRAQLPTDHVAELVGGFEEMYRFLMKHRDALLQKDGPLATMNGQPLRFIFRPTMVYLRTLEQALAPRYLRCGVDVSVELARMCQAFVGGAERPKAWPILAAELQALERLDVPHFTHGTDENSLSVGTASRIEQYFRRSAYEECALRVKRMNDADLLLQSDIIRGCVHARIADVHAGGAAATVERLNQPDTSGRARIAVSTTPALESAAQAIAEDIERRSLRVSPDSIDWLGLSYFRKTKRMHVDLLGDSLFDGRCGVALFLAAYGSITGHGTSRDLALEALGPVRRRLRADRRSAERFSKGMGIGGAAGIGSVVYSLVAIGRLLRDETLIADACHAADLLANRAIESALDLDVIDGAAGAALSLLALHRETGDSKSISTATACARRLCDARVWHAPSDTASDGVTPKLGFAHGTAGMWLTLLRLYSVTREPALLRTAEEILIAERKHVRWPTMNATDDRATHPGVPLGLLGSWCNGIAGIGLARLGGLPVLANDEVEEQIEAAVSCAESWSLEGVDHLCCGNFGRIELLLVAAERLSRPRLLAAATNAAVRILDRRHRSHGYRLQGDLFSAPCFDPSFFHGAAGIGYGFLRVAHPNSLRSVALWD
jgi:type 2 lantibiotic biosynthesis protein LanM